MYIYSFLGIKNACLELHALENSQNKISLNSQNKSICLRMLLRVFKDKCFQKLFNCCTYD